MTNKNRMFYQTKNSTKITMCFFFNKMWYVSRILLENIKKFDVHSEKLQQNIEKRDAGIEILRLCSKY